MQTREVADLLGKSVATVIKGAKKSGFEIKRGKGGNDWSAKQVAEIKKNIS
jgi:hypothetical protein